MRHDYETYVFGTDISRCKPCSGYQLLQSGSHTLIYDLKAILHQSSVFIHKRHNISDSSYGHQVQYFRKDGLRETRLLLKGLSQFESHSAAAKLLKRIFASRLLGIDQKAFSHGIRDGMMIGDQYLHAKFFGISDFIFGHASAVYGHYQIKAFIVDESYCFRVKSIAFAEPGRNIVIQVLRSVLHEVTQYAHHEGGGSDAVSIIVTVYHDPGAVPDFMQYKIRTCFHIRKQERIVCFPRFRR